MASNPSLLLCMLCAILLLPFSLLTVLICACCADTEQRTDRLSGSLRRWWGNRSACRPGASTYLYSGTAKVQVVCSPVANPDWRVFRVSLSEHPWVRVKEAIGLEARAHWQVRSAEQYKDSSTA